MTPLGPFDNARRVVVGVSGGADSMALAVLLSRWGKPLPCIVDHGLRTGSAQEAALTAGRLAALGIPVRVVQAEVKRGSGLSDRARRARYALLLEACERAGCADLLVAHHAQDQAETVRMRRDAGSGPLGLSGMAAVVYRDAARLLRPLLGIHPQRLRATLRQAGVRWVEDPGNLDPATLRGGLRASMGDAEVLDGVDAARRHGAARSLAEQALAEELAMVAIHPEGTACAPGPLSPAALSALVWMLSGRAYPPSRSAAEAGLQPRTLHGVVILRAGRLGPGWLLAREPAAVAPPVPASAGTRWDGRFALIAHVQPDAMLGALGQDAARFRRSRLPSAVLRGLPALRRKGELWMVPHLAFPDAETCLNVPLSFGPACPAAGAPFRTPG